MSRWVDQYETHAFRASLDGGFFVFLTLWEFTCYHYEYSYKLSPDYS